MIAQILIADDNPDITGLLSDYLSTKGNRVIIVNDGYQLAEKAGEYRPHLIITDIQMPGAYGSSAYLVLQKDRHEKYSGDFHIGTFAHEARKSFFPMTRTRFIKSP